ncbi:MAG TPA: nucleotidyltransferase family protein, partial [Candidatus Caenarcaniphilales bacterium]
MKILSHFPADSPSVASPEVELLLCCARTTLDPGIAERMRTLLQANLNWKFLVEIAFCHGVTPLLFWHLKAAAPEAVPTACWLQLQTYFHTNARRNLFLTGELLPLLKFFEAHNIPAIAFKGPLLALSVYGNLALRQFGDLDILVRAGDVCQAKELLVAQGYQLRNQRGWESSFLHTQTGVIVDLHQGLTPWYFPFALDFERLWARRSPLSLLGRLIPNLLPEDLLLILCVQGTKDCWDRREKLAQVCDVAELIRRQPLDWQRVLEQASHSGSQQMLLRGLGLAHKLLGVVLPTAVLQKVHSSVIEALVTQGYELLFSQAKVPATGSERRCFYFSVRERLQDRAAYFLYCAITPSQQDLAMLSLPQFLYFLYYLLRPLRLIGVYAQRPSRTYQRLKQLLRF